VDFSACDDPKVHVAVDEHSGDGPLPESLPFLTPLVGSQGFLVEVEFDLDKGDVYLVDVDRLAREQHAGVAAPRPEGASRIRKALCEDCLSVLSRRPVKELHHTASVMTAGDGPRYNPGQTLFHGAGAVPARAARRPHPAAAVGGRRADAP